MQGWPLVAQIYDRDPQISSLTLTFTFLQMQPAESQVKAQERALRARIQDVLVDYALKHLTTNYITYTQDIVAEVC
jgi:hypothetical protein